MTKITYYPPEGGDAYELSYLKQENQDLIQFNLGNKKLFAVEAALLFDLLRDLPTNILEDSMARRIDTYNLGTAARVFYDRVQKSLARS